MVDVTRQKARLLNTQGFVHKPLVFEEFSAKKEPQGNFTPMQHPSLSSATQVASRDEDVMPHTEAVYDAPKNARFTEEELLAAQKEAEEIGRQKGKQEGLTEARSQMDAEQQQQQAMLAALLQQLTDRLDAEVAAFHQAREQMRAQLAPLVLAISEKLVGNALETQPLSAIEGMVDECLAMLAGEAELRIHVHPEAQAILEQYLNVTPREAGQNIIVVGDNALQPGDCHIRWPGGTAERNQQELWSEVEEIISRALS